MTLTVQVVGWLVSARRASERRQWAAREAAVVMERLTALPWDRVTADSANDLAYSEQVKNELPEGELTVSVDEPGRSRIEAALRPDPLAQPSRRLGRARTANGMDPPQREDPSMNRRPGYSLIEMVLVIGALSVVLGLCVGTIRGLITLDRSGRARVNEEAALSRLARQLRQDARGALSGRLVGEKDKTAQLDLRLSSEQVVEYRWVDGRVTRTKRGPGKTERREVYRLPNRAKPRFQVGDEAGQTWVSLVLERKPDVSAPRASARVPRRSDAR